MGCIMFNGISKYYVIMAIVERWNNFDLLVSEFHLRASFLMMDLLIFFDALFHRSSHFDLTMTLHNHNSYNTVPKNLMNNRIRLVVAGKNFIYCRVILFLLTLLNAVLPPQSSSFIIFIASCLT